MLKLFKIIKNLILTISAIYFLGSLILVGTVGYYLYQNPEPRKNFAITTTKNYFFVKGFFEDHWIEEGSEQETDECDRYEWNIGYQCFFHQATEELPDKKLSLIGVSLMWSYGLKSIIFSNLEDKKISGISDEIPLNSKFWQIVHWAKFMFSNLIKTWKESPTIVERAFKFTWKEIF